jgi:uncharacterized protein YkwD
MATVLGVAAMLALGEAGPTAAQDPGSCPDADATTAAPEQLAAAALCLVNEARAQAGLPSLAPEAHLAAAARAHAAMMAAEDRYATDGTDGSTPASRAADVGYDGTVHEAVGAGQGTLGTPRAVVALWLREAGARGAILAPRGTQGGAGVARTSGGQFGAGAPVYALFVGDGPRPGTPPSATPAPVAGKSVVVEVISGIVTVRRSSTRSVARAAAAPKALNGTAVVPLGSIVDATRGRLELTAATGTGGGTQHAQFFDGAFTPAQRSAGGALVTVLRLRGSLAGCPRAGTARAAARKRRRLLWGSGKGKYSTEGKYASASVRGTVWLTEDRCDGTYVRVVRGVVRVRDRRTGRARDVRAGRSVLIRRRR